MAPWTPQAPTELILGKIRERAATEAVNAASSPGEGGGDIVQRLCLGLTWTACRTGAGLGFAMSPGMPSRTLDWPGSLAGRPARELAAWLASWDPFQATVGLAAANALINQHGQGILAAAKPIPGDAGGSNLAPFHHFRPLLTGRKVVVVGRYPGLDQVLSGLDVTVLERQPGPADLPDPAAEFLLPQADWVFLTATSLINKTFARLAALSRRGVTVLMGPSTPWLAEWADFGIDFLAGVQVVDADRAEQIAMEGGGVRLFGEGARYAVVDLRGAGGAG